MNRIVLIPILCFYINSLILFYSDTQSKRRLTSEYLPIISNPISNHSEYYNSDTFIYKADSLELKLKQVLHLEDYRGKFELSGFSTSDGNNIYAVTDNNEEIFSISIFDSVWRIQNTIYSVEKGKDLEGICNCGEEIYFINERPDNNAYEFANKSVKALTRKSMFLPDNNTAWGNAGLEGIAINCNDNILYLAKERDMPALFKFENGKISTLETNFSSDTDISDLVFFNNFLYILERKKHAITKLDDNGKFIISFSFRHITMKEDKQMYNGKQEHGSAEALMFIGKKIYIGMDPLGNKIQEWFINDNIDKGAKKSGHISVILELEMPEEF